MAVVWMVSLEVTDFNLIIAIIWTVGLTVCMQKTVIWIMEKKVNC